MNDEPDYVHYDEHGDIDDRFTQSINDTHAVMAIISIAAAGLLLLMVAGVALLIWGC